MPLESGLNFKVGQAGVYCTFEVSVRCTDLHIAGDLKERGRLFGEQMQWMMWAMDQQAQVFNSARKAMGQSGEWVPSGQFQQPTTQATTTPTVKKVNWP